jgi:hypothetical protein
MGSQIMFYVDDLMITDLKERGEAFLSQPGLEFYIICGNYGLCYSEYISSRR